MTKQEIVQAMYNIYAMHLNLIQLDKKEEKERLRIAWDITKDIKTK